MIGAQEVQERACGELSRRLFDADDASIHTFVSHPLDARELVIENPDGARRAFAATAGGPEFTDAVLARARLRASVDKTRVVASLANTLPAYDNSHGW